MRLGIGLAVICALYACGGKVETNNLAVSSTGGIGNANTATAGVCTSSAVTFQIVPAANTTNSWCLGSPSWSDKCRSAAIRSESGYLELGQRVSGCDASECGKPLVVPPFDILGDNTQLTADGLTLTWTGAYFADATCGAASENACEHTQCAAQGQYTIDVCVFQNPNPTWSDGCLEAGDQTPVTTFSTIFDYPADATVLLTLPN